MTAKLADVRVVGDRGREGAFGFFCPVRLQLLPVKRRDLPGMPPEEYVGETPLVQMTIRPAVKVAADASSPNR